MTLLVLGQRQFNGVLDAVPALSRKLLSAMSTRFRESDDKPTTKVAADVSVGDDPLAKVLARSARR